MTTYYLILSAATFIIWGVDKFRARLNQWRVPERILFTLVILGGAFGALAGMLIFRHKTRKNWFWLLVGLSCAVHLWIWIFLTPGLAE